MRFTLSAALAALLANTVLATDLTVYLPSTPNPFSLPPTTHATLTALHKRTSAPISTSNTFVFRNVTPGSYLLDVHCDTDGFRPLRVDITAATVEGEEALVEAWETYRGNDWGNKGEKLVVRDGSVGRGFEVKAMGSKEYFIERPKFSVLAILKSPMILMALVSLGLVFGMPKMMENMDPEMRAEFEETQRAGPMASLMGGTSGGPAPENPIANFDMAAYLAGSGKKDKGQGSSKK